ncbi:tyrosine-type recombinase/integrase [Vibrio mimicus]
MNSLKSLLTEDIKRIYLIAAQNEFEDYLKITENENISIKDKLKFIENVYEFTRREALVNNGHILHNSLSKIQSRFSKQFEAYNLQLKLLELLLCVIDKNLKISSPNISQNCEIKQDLPTLRPDDFLMSRLQKNIYELIENELEIYKFLDNPKINQAILILWLVLKEGINNSNSIKAILSRECDIYKIQDHWFIELNNRRYWLSPMAETLLTAYWSVNVAAKVDLMKKVNDKLYKNRLLPFNYSLKFIDLRSFLKNEFILTVSPVEYTLCQTALPTTSIPQLSLFRLISGQRVLQEPNKDENKQRKMTIRQKVAWLSACASSAEKLRKKTTVSQAEITTIEQIKLIEHFTTQLVKAPLRESIQINYKLQHELRDLLEKNNIAKATPWSWLVLSWLYHLLKFGGKHKSRLRLTTIKSYITYIAEPFIQEFSGCAPKQMDNLDWAEKLNAVTEQIISAKKSYLLYFSEFLIDSGLVANLCLSDIDIPSISHSINANLITQQEGDKILRACDEINTPLSNMAKLCFCFGFYSGLRRGEITGLQFNDITIAGKHYVNLHIRPNKYRELKSSESSRNIPLDCLWPEEQLTFLVEYLAMMKTKFTHAKSLIFSNINELNNAFTLLTNIMKIVTGELNLRFHHCRHSFCNWTWILLNSDVLRELSGVHFCQHPYFSFDLSQKLCQRLAISPFSRKKIWALSGLLGHISPGVTISSYFHISEFVRRTKFAKHSPTPTLLRRFWGQRIRIDQHGKLITIPDSKQHHLKVYPLEYTPEVDHSCISVAIQKIDATSDMILSQRISLRSVWDIIRLVAEGHKVNDVSHTLGIDEKLVRSILYADENITKTSLSRSKYKFEPLANYNKLNRGNIRVINTLIFLFENAENKNLIPAHFNLDELDKILIDLVGSKDCLIRTHNTNAALIFLKMIKLIGLNRRHVKVKWYFPSEKYYHPDQIDNYKLHLMFWHNKIVQEIPLEIKIEVMVSKSFSTLVKSSQKFKTTVSDEGKYLKYYPPGTISIHVLQSKFDHERYDKHGNKIYIPKRTKAFISFVRLLAIYFTCIYHFTNR